MIWTIIEKLISGLLLIFGIITCYDALDYAIKVSSDSDSISWIQLVINQLYFWILGIVAIVSGLLLALNKKTGWQLSVSFLLSLILSGIINQIFRPELFFERSKNDILTAIGLILIMGLILWLLLNKNIRRNYKLVSRDFLFIGASTLFLIIMGVYL